MDDDGYPALFQSLFVIMLYFPVRQRLGRTGGVLVRQVGYLFSQMMIILLILFVWRLFSGEPFSYIYIPNISLLSVLIAMNLAFMVGQFYSVWCNGSSIWKRRRLFDAGIMVIGLSMLVFTRGRSGWLGFVAAVLLLNMVSRIRRKFLPAKLWVCMMIFIVTLVVLIQVKVESSSGRILIYKISFQMLADQWLWGIGQGEFAKQYNLYQGRYFESADIDNEEALLADNVYYAFNDLLQLLIENGVVGGMIFLLAILLFIKRIRRILNSDNGRMILPFLAMLICASVSSFFIYPFHHLPAILWVILSLAYCNSLPERKVLIRLPRIFWLERSLYALLAVLLVARAAHEYVFRRKATIAGELARAGLKQKAIVLYYELDYNYSKDGKTLFEYARLRYQSGELALAARTIEKAKQLFISNELFLFAGMVYAEMGHYAIAEVNYKTALYMVPNRMRSRYGLMRLYFQWGDSVKAKYWARSIIQMPVKVESKKVEMMRKDAFGILKGKS